jgi:hypothetical protein
MKTATIFRKRVKKNRFGYSRGPCYRGYHFGKYSYYTKVANSRGSGLFSLQDTQGHEIVNGVVTVS